MHTSQTSSNSDNSPKNRKEYLEQVKDAFFNDIDFEMRVAQQGCSRKNILIGLSNGSFSIEKLFSILNLDIEFDKDSEKINFQRDLTLALFILYLDPKNKSQDEEDPTHSTIRSLLENIRKHGKQKSEPVEQRTHSILKDVVGKIFQKKQ